MKAVEIEICASVFISSQSLLIAGLCVIISRTYQDSSAQVHSEMKVKLSLF